MAPLSQIIVVEEMVRPKEVFRGQGIQEAGDSSTLSKSE
jgi:hypothetical protein